MHLPEFNRNLLHKLARRSIAHGLTHDAPCEVDLHSLPSDLQAIRATFVTLEKGGQLRGCIGTLEPELPLAQDVALRAYEAAFRDPRFSPITAPELDDLSIRISVLSPTEPIAFTDEADLLSRLRPGVDGLIIAEGFRRATFLPAVWEDLPDRHDFLRHLKRKADMDPHYWSPEIRAWRYETESF